MPGGPPSGLDVPDELLFRLGTVGQAGVRLHRGRQPVAPRYETRK